MSLTFSHILSEVRRRVDVAIPRRSQDAWTTPLMLEKDWFRALAAQSSLSLREFEDALGYILDQLWIHSKPARLVLLLDEMDETVEQDWTADLYNQLRSLVYSGDLKQHVRFVLSGSERFLDAMNNRGSPLWNILKIHYLPALSQVETQELMHRAEGLNEEEALAVSEQSGGHPFLAQYLLYYLWDAKVNSNAVMTVANVVNRFLYEMRGHIEGWAKSIEVIGLQVYGQLANQSGWLDETDIMKAVNAQNADVKRSLIALYYHGLIEHDGNWNRYRHTSDIFRDWYNENGSHFIETLLVEQFDFPTLRAELAKLRSALRDEDNDSAHAFAEELSSAEEAALEENGRKVRETVLKVSSKSGKWLIDFSTKIGADVIANMMKSGIGL